MKNFKKNSTVNCIKAINYILKNKEVKFFTSESHCFVFESRADLNQIINTFESQSIWIGDGQCVVECTANYADGRSVYKEFFYENGTRCSQDEMFSINDDADRQKAIFWADIYSVDKLAQSLSDLIESGMPPDTFDYRGDSVPYGVLTDSYGMAV